MSIYRRGDVWWYKFRFAGQVIRESSKSNSKTVAKEAERARRRELEGNWNGIVKKRTLPPPLDRAGTAWLEAKKPHIAQRTYEIYDVALRCHLKPAMGTLLLCDVDAGQIAAYQAKRKSEGADARTLNKELQVRQILKKHKLWANLQGDVKFEREHNDIGKALSREDENKLLAACSPNALLNAVVTLALNTTMRKNEIRTLRWSQVDFEKRTLTVGKSKTDGSSGRLIPLNPPAFDALIKWAGRLVESDSTDYVFPACEAAGIERKHPDKKRIDPSRPITSWRTAWRTALKRAGLRLRFHDLRHTCITKLSESQASEQTIMAIAGHLSRKMLEHYSHIRMEAKRAAVDAIAAQPAQTVFEVGGAQNRAQSQPKGKAPVAN
jgi:integrase